MRLVLILPALGGWKAESTYKHCSNGVQPVPKAVYRSGFREKKTNGKQRIVRKGRIVLKLCLCTFAVCGKIKCQLGNLSHLPVTPHRTSTGDVTRT